MGVGDRGVVQAGAHLLVLEIAALVVPGSRYDSTLLLLWYFGLQTFNLPQGSLISQSTLGIRETESTLGHRGRGKEV